MLTMPRLIRLQYEVLVLIVMVGIGRTQNWHFTGENRALNKSTEQGPGTTRVLHNGRYIIGSSGLAVDGNTDNDFFRGSCSHTTSGTGPYWSVDLGDTYFVKGVRIYTRTDQDRQDFDNFKVIGFPNETTLHNDVTANPKLARNRVINIPVSPVQFSSITITIPGKAYLILCEVEIFGVLDLKYCSTEYTDNKLVWDVSYGYIDTERNVIVEDSVIQFSCPTYYTLSGPTSATCLATGSYNQSIPRCRETPCQPPSTIPHGAYNQDLKLEYAYYEYVTWECSQGYKSGQNKTRQCLPTSKWSGTGPVCTLFMCPYPSSFSNGELETQNGTLYKQGIALGDTIVTVSCDNCFKSNTDTTVCTPDEVWSPAPQCTQVECASLGSITGGYYNYSNPITLGGNYVCGTIVNISCYDNFKKIVDIRSCGQNGSWSGSDAQPCKRICKAPPEFPNGSYKDVLKKEYSVGTILTWHCFEGFSSKYNRTCQCLGTSTWSCEDPVCTLIMCPFPSIKTGVSLAFDDGSAYSSGPIPSRAAVNVFCDDCFEFNVQRISCGLDMEWNNVPTCSRITCDELGTVPGGLYTYRDKDGIPLANTEMIYTCGTVAEVFCDVGYIKIEDNRTCGQGGGSSWSGKDVVCVAKPSPCPSRSNSWPAVAGGIGGSLFVVGIGVGIVVSPFFRKWVTRRRSKHPTSAKRRPPAPVSSNYDNLATVGSDGHAYTELNLTSVP